MKNFKLDFLGAFLAILLIGSLSAQAQEARPSPPATAKATVGGTTVTINYSQPAVKGRTVWGGLVPYGSVWRTGANEATTIEVSADINVGGKTLKKGKYSLFTIPGKDEWTIIINAVSDQWGAFSYDKTKDAMRFTAKPGDSKMNERFTITISDSGTASLAWEKIKVDFKIG